eukprot:4762777-Ditylum_brightwellii.AAC.1
MQISHSRQGKAENVPKSTKCVKAKSHCECIFLDIATMKGEKNRLKFNLKCNWRIMIDEYPTLRMSHFFTTKSGMVEPTLELFHKWMQTGIHIQFIHCNNMGQNKWLEKRTKSSDWKFNITFEYMSSDTPQQNHLAEFGFVVLAACGCTLLHCANVPKVIQFQVFPKACEKATLLDGVVVVEVNGVKSTKYEHFCGKLPIFLKYLKQWGKAGTVKVQIKTTPKLDDCSITCMMIGYAIKHKAD